MPAPFTPNPSFFVVAPVLQNLLVDKDSGAPLSGGKIFFYEDTARNILKNVYQQVNNNPPYSYVVLPNPIILNAVGAISSDSIDDILPYYYPVTEDDNSTPQAYYVVIQNSEGVTQETRENFPFVAPTPAPIASSSNLKNILYNGEFWRNVVGAGTTPTGQQIQLVNGSVLAPGAHDGFSMPDIQFLFNNSGATYNLNFNKFPQNTVLTGEIAPEYYFSYNTSGGTGGSFVGLQFPLSLHLLTLPQPTITVTFLAESITTAFTIQVQLLQFNGSDLGTESIQTIGSSLTISPSGWSKYTVSAPINPNTSTPSNTGDDAYYLQFNFQFNSTVNINFAKPKVYLNTNSLDIPTNEFSSYDEIDSIINSWRTGDIRQSANTFSPFGWVPMNDGTIGKFIPSGYSNTVPIARMNIDTWPLYSYLWNTFHEILDDATAAAYLPIYDNTGALTTYSANPGGAVADWDLGKQLSLTKMAGRVLLGSTPMGVNSVVTASGNVLTLVTPFGFFAGMPVMFTTTGTLPAPLVINTVYYLTFTNPYASNTVSVASSYANAIALNPITLTTTGSGTNTITAYMAGTYSGEYAHTQTLTELVNHGHSLISPGTIATFTANGSSAAVANVANTSNSSGPSARTFNLTANPTYDNTGGSQPFNIVQPGVFQNIFIKL